MIGTAISLGKRSKMQASGKAKATATQSEIFKVLQMLILIPRLQFGK